MRDAFSKLLFGERWQSIRADAQVDSSSCRALRCRESLMSFWHVFEYLCNTLIFFLAGALTGSLGASQSSLDMGEVFV